MFLGLDLGTSGLRALLIDANGTPVDSASANYPVQHPHAGWSEQDPQSWIDALETVMAELATRQRDALRALQSIGVSGHMHGATLLDGSGAVLRPCILWNDTRSYKQAAQLDLQDGVRDKSGNIVFPGFTAPKLLWLRDAEPAIFDKVAKVLLPAAFLNFHLTGAYFADMSDSAGTTWLHTGKRAWSDDLLAAGGMRRDQMPDLVEGCEVGGVLRPELAQKWGLRDDVQVVGGAGDNAAAACGVGAMGEGQGFVSLGTSGVLLAGRDGYAPLPASAVHTFCHAVPDKWYQMGVILAATDCLNWFAAMANSTPQALSNALPTSISGPSDVRFLPYLSGERTPHNDSQIRGAFIGLGVNTEQTNLTQAVMEGVAFALADCAAALEQSGAQLGGMLAIGGGSKSRFWVETIATVLGQPMSIPVAGDFGAALGAARLAAVGAGAGSISDIMTAPPIFETIDPVASLHPRYQAAQAQYRALYPAIKDIS